MSGNNEEMGREHALAMKALLVSGDFAKKDGFKEEASHAVALMEKIAKQSDDEQWLAFIANKEIPPVKLSAAEMESLRGGHWLEDLVVGVFWSYEGARTGSW